MVKTVTCLAFRLACLNTAKLLSGGASYASGGQEAVKKIVESDIHSSVCTVQHHACYLDGQEEKLLGGRLIDESHPPSLLLLADGPQEER